MGFADKMHFARLMIRAFRKSDWNDWFDRSAQDLIDAWASPGVRRAMFEPLTQIKFGLPCSEVSGAWLGARLHHREGSAPLGYIPGKNWTDVLCTGLSGLLADLGVRVVTRAKIVRFRIANDRISEVETESGDAIGADAFVNTIPTPALKVLLPEEDSPGLREIEYTALTSVICATPQRLEPDFYWMNLVSLDRAASGLFRLESLNPTLGNTGESYLNFVTHTRSRAMPFFGQPEDDLRAQYGADFQAVFGEPLRARWTQVNRIAMYSPVFFRDYRNPPLSSTRFSNLWFAGNYRTFPSVVSTGTALRSGLETAQAILEGGPRHEDVLAAATRFRAPSMARSLDRAVTASGSRQPRVVL